MLGAGLGPLAKQPQFLLASDFPGSANNCLKDLPCQRGQISVKEAGLTSLLNENLDVKFGTENIVGPSIR